MGFWDKLRGELIDIIEWTDSSNDTLLYRFERYQNEIKNGAKLVVREGQEAIFVNEGKIADVFKPGTYTLETKNLPILSTLKGWAHGFNSPFKAEVYFVNTRQFTDLKWGTKNPVMMRDQDFGMVRFRAFGTYCIRVDEPTEFLREIVGTDGHFKTGEISDQLRNLIITRFSDAIAESKIPILDLSMQYNELGDTINDQIAPEFKEYGIQLTKFLIENISLPKNVEEALDKRTSMGVIGNMNQYTQFQAANAMEKASENPAGGGAAEGMGLGMGFAMANQMSQSMNPQQSAPQGPPPPPQAKVYHVANNGEQSGPYDLQTLTQQIAIGHVTPQSHVWTQGMSAWQLAKDVEDVARLFQQGPPPPPPPAP